MQRAEPIVKHCYDFTWTSEEMYKERITAIINDSKSGAFYMINLSILSGCACHILKSSAQKIFDGVSHLISSKIIKKLTIITTDTGAKIYTDQINNNSSLLNNPKLENPDFKRKSLNAVYDFLSVKVHFSSNFTKVSIVEKTLIRAHFI
ncbi:hypothetical protein HHL23_18185 [Chryseobacterium sp. RP-3-3]|uniref:Uncharacterized protein n=1 Tax=Chryseobacterium antibioticum TaxID=2728847 RepID=A0A7Y0AQN8_9FLAO|nr:hypothetical protein [Chryseobacterium antibioticum]NML71710.1 hypothetical protein [Chryseobacterium antibioticum]